AAGKQDPAHGRRHRRESRWRNGPVRPRVDRAMNVAELRREKDDYFRRADDSPLTPEERRGFTGLRYFPEDAHLRFIVTLDRTAAGGVEEVEMSNGSTTEMRRVGVVRCRRERTGSASRSAPASSSFISSPSAGHERGIPRAAGAL